MKRILSYLGITLSFYLMFLIATLPAERAYDWFKAQVPNIKVYALDGSVWSGKADAIEIDGQVLREFEWSIRLMSLFMGRVESEISFDNNASWAKGSVGKSLLSGDILVKDLTGQVSAEELQSMLPSIPAKLGGSFQLTFDDLAYSTDASVLTLAEGYVDWRDASVTVLQKAAIGDFQVDLTTTDLGISGVFSDANAGPLSVQGSLTLSPDKTYQVDATLNVRDKSRQDLVQSLRFLGQQDARGNVTFSQGGSL